LPNIDINIKCGNSLISRFGLDVDVKQVLQKQKFSIEQYRNAVQTYRSAESKAQKREMEGLIAKIKEGFSSSLSGGDPKKVKLRQLQAELYSVENQTLLFEETKAEIKVREKRVNKLNNEIDKLSAEIEDIESGRLYENALEWRFEFHEVLNDDGDFVGFDIVIGNPPYALVGSDKIGEQEYFKNKFQMTSYKINIYLLFVEKGLNLLGKLGSQLSYIIPKSLVFNTYFAEPRRLIMSHYAVSRITEIDEKVFEDAEVGDSIIFSAYKSESPLKNNLVYERVQASNSFEILDSYINSQENLLKSSEANFYISSSINFKVSTYLLKDIVDISNGLNSGNVRHILFASEKLTEKHQKLLLGKDIKNYSINWSGTWVNYDPNLKNTLTVNDIKSKDGMNAQSKVDFALRKREIFCGDKILIRKTSDSIIAAYDKDSYYFDSLAYGIKVKSSIDISIFYILGLLNSTLMNWFHSNLSNNKGKIFAKVLKENLDKLPIAYENTEKFKTSQVKIVNLVDEILTAKKGDRHTDTSELEKAIDALVYQLYGLTEEEIKIVEGER
jgi:adenine-specific DNA-methyltransferase